MGKQPALHLVSLQECRIGGDDRAMHGKGHTSCRVLGSVSDRNGSVASKNLDGRLLSCSGLRQTEVHEPGDRF